jgi:hypothetical protein
LDKLTPDVATRERVKKYIDDEIAKSHAANSAFDASSSSTPPPDRRTSTPDIPASATDSVAPPAAVNGKKNSDKPQVSRVIVSLVTHVFIFFPLYQAANAGTSSNSTTDDVEGEVTYDTQPGLTNYNNASNMNSNNNNNYINPSLDMNITIIQNHIAQTQANMQRIMMMLNQPTLVPPMRIQFQMQYQGLLHQLGNLQQMLMGATAASSSSVDGMGGMGMMNMMGGMGVTGQQQMMNNGNFITQGAMAQRSVGGDFQSAPVFNNPGHPNGISPSFPYVCT